MYVVLDPRSSEPIYEQIIKQVKLRILQGVVVAGDRVPSVRELSAELLVNPNTVSKAYRELERDLIFVTYRGKGTFVAEDVKEELIEKEISMLRENLDELVNQAVQVNIEKETLHEWIEEVYQRRGGEPK